MTIKTQLQQNNSELHEHYAYIPIMPTADESRNGQYTWHKYSVVGGAKGQSIGFVVDDSETAYPIDGIHTDGFYYVLYGAPFPIVSWADGTDEEIVTMVQAADKGLIKLSDYWAVGQERKVTLSAMSATGVGESHAEQEVTFVLMNVGGKELASPVESGRTECSFVVGLKNCLNEKGNMDLSSSDIDGWKGTTRRTWCNNVFKSSIPETLLPIFKEFKNLSGTGIEQTNGVNETTDYFALPSEIEVLGKVVYSLPGEGTQFQWYKTVANRKKKIGDNGSINIWWLRSVFELSNLQFCSIIATGASDWENASSELYISPFGCI